MTTGHAGRAARAAGLAAVFAGLTLGLMTAVSPPRAAVAAQEEKKTYPRPSPDQKKEHGLYGASGCQTCHNNLQPKNDPEAKQTYGFEFVRLWENKVWEAHDLHSMAYRNLVTDRTPNNDAKYPTNKTAQRMEDKLRKYKGKDYIVANDTACLACHASTLKPLDAEPYTAWKADSFAPIQEGVGCEMCHGHGSMYSERHKTSRFAKGNAPATKVVDWREYPPEVKHEWGMNNLRDPATAVRTCASCHVGNKAAGRFVTHEMFAAGHPPLPPLDLLAYTREQPRHWGLAGDMPYITRLAEKDEKDKTDKAFVRFHYRQGESFVARRFAESTLAALGATATLGAQLADDAKAKSDGLDFAAFDCYSCHHNLKYPSERQDRGYVGRPGRPLYRPAAFALARLVLDHAGGMKDGAALKGAAEELDRLELELADAFTVKTYGDADKVKAATQKIAAWSEAAGKKLEPVRYTPDEVTKLLTKLTATASEAKKPVGDPEVAQLYLWAIETLYLDLQPKELTEKKVEPVALKTMRGATATSVVTRLRPDTDFYYEQSYDDMGNPSPINKPTTNDAVERRLEKRMDIFNSFRGEPFRKAIEGLTLPK
ncbi:multiheme c-type cytochrome [Gemmata sp. JC717]|uniref:multiheme c-type cytochrome n=1 Tax=Gemmata algarum TaxID=2975278 RepID=UPI0021BB672B|nr:multiheme c-type cytochrome [Gemmata algarum]MDY3551896.1 multiheme c-type cytochrome [Gemmata algarum]